MRICVLGSGTWGTALAQVLTDNGHQVTIYGNNQEQIDDISKHHQNQQYFGNEITLSPSIKATTSLSQALDGKSIVLVAVPSNAIRAVLSEVRPLLKSRKYFINTAKGIEAGTEKRMSQVFEDVIPQELRHPLVSLIGPSHAEEVILRMVTAITATSHDLRTARHIQSIFANNYFRVYTNNDEIGAEIGVAMKNAIAIASGALAGLGYGDNARAALVTRGLHEMVNFGTRLGGKLKTYLGLTGLGDLMVTCNSLHSRNFVAGYKIGKDDSASDFWATNKATVEGIYATKVIYRMGKEMDIDLPIINAVYAVLYEDKRPSELLANLMVRPLKDESDE